MTRARRANKRAILKEPKNVTGNTLDNLPVISNIYFFFILTKHKHLALKFASIKNTSDLAKI